MGLKKEEVTIALVDAINIYPSIKLVTIKKAVRFFARTLTRETKKTINFCLDLIQFGMRSTLISFDGEYYEYHGGEIEEQGSEIGGYESAFLADLVASYLFEKSKLIYACQSTTASIKMTAWCFSKERRRRVILKTGLKSFRKR